MTNKLRKNTKTKDEVLAKYAKRDEPLHLAQIDGWRTDYEWPDGSSPPYTLTSASTDEMMSMGEGGIGVRILIQPDTPPADAAALLRKAAAWVERGHVIEHAGEFCCFTFERACDDRHTHDIAVQVVEEVAELNIKQEEKVQ